MPQIYSGNVPYYNKGEQMELFLSKMQVNT